METDQVVGHVVVLGSPQFTTAYKGPGVAADRQCVHPLRLDAGPYPLSGWSVGSAVAFEPAFDGATPDDDPGALFLDGQSLLGTLTDGSTVLTAPVVEARTVAGVRYAQVADGLLFQLGVPSTEWTELSDDPEGMVETFMQAYAPLDAEPLQ